MNPQRRLWLRQLAASTGAAWAPKLAVGATAVSTQPASGPSASLLSASSLATSTSTAAPASPSAPREAITEGVRLSRRLRFPQDHGAHVAQRIEWWYATGWLGTEAAPSHGWQVTFFRSATGLGQGSRSRFAPRHVLFAHAAVADLAAQQHRHAQRMARWSGLPDAAPDGLALDRGALRLAGWSLTDHGPGWRIQVADAGFAFDMDLQRTQPLLLQGDAGFSLKGPPSQSYASHYYSEPQLAAQARLTRGGGTASTHALQGRAWLDHEWSDTLLPPYAVGWDWIGFNLFDGSALTAFRLRRADGSTLWAGGSWRPASHGRSDAAREAGSGSGSGSETRPRPSGSGSSAGSAAGPQSAVGATQNFASDRVVFQPGARWRSGASGADYPVQWAVTTPAGHFEVRALLQAQELDSRTGTGAFYWEGLSELLDGAGRRIGLGYLEMTGYAGRLRLS